MDSALKQMIAIGLICALIGGIVGGLAISLISDSDDLYGEVILHDLKPGLTPGGQEMMHATITSTHDGKVDIYRIGGDPVLLCTIEVYKGYCRYVVDVPSTLTPEYTLLVWHP